MPKKSRKVEPPLRTVHCADCRHFHRDTEGINRRADTGEYFMGVSDIGCDPDHTFNSKTGVAKIFADKPRICETIKPIKQ